MRSNIAIWLSIFFSLVSLPSLFAQEEFPHVEGEILIRVKNNHSIAWVVKDLELYKGLQTQIQARRLLSDHLNIWQLTFNDDVLTHSTMLDMAKLHPSVGNAQLNYIMEKRVTPNDASYNQQWQYEQSSDFDLDAEAAWDITTGGVTAAGDTIVVCVIDDGVQVDHPDWGDNIWYNHHEIAGNGIDDDNNGYVDDYRGWNADNNNNNIVATGFANHGTPVAGIVAAQGNNGIGVSGVNWDVKMMFVVGGGNSAQAIAAYSYPLACRKLYNQTNGAQGAFVVATNASWGVNNQDCATFAPLMNELYDTLGTYGVLNAGATANANTNVDTQGDFPTSCTSDYLFAITNINQSGTKVTQAGYGSTHIDLGAYGEGTYTIAVNSSYAGFGGTSGATPHVAGTIGLLYSAPCPRLAQMAKSQPAQTALLMKQIIMNSGVSNTSLQGITASGNVLNMKSALDSVMAIGCSISGCHEPYNPAYSSVTGTAATINWDGVDSTTLYYLRYREVGAATWSTTTSTDTFETLNSLTACTDYEVQIAANCDSTAYSSTLTFKTGDCCNAPATINTTAAGTTTASFSWGADAFVNSYTVEFKLQSSSTWMTSVTNTNSITLSNLDSCEFYDLRIISTCPVNVNNTYSQTVKFETVGCGKCTSSNYCASGGQSSNDDWIENVTFGNINNSTGNDNGYASFVNSGPTTDVVQGGTYPISVELGFNTGPWPTNWRIKVWIDYNQDEVFDDVNELAYDPGAISSPTAVHNGNITIPANALLSRTRMRVGIKWGTTVVDPCTSPQYGETEDYCINVVAPTSTTTLAHTASSLNVYPNPFNEQLHVALYNAEAESATITLKSITGQEIMQSNYNLNKGNNNLTLTNQALPTGMYLVAVQLDNGTLMTQKVIKK